MTPVSRIASFSAAAVLLAIGASAQESSKGPDAPPIPRWDIGASIGGFGMGMGTIDREHRTASTERFTVGDGWVAVAFGAEIGHYWTQHWKSELGFIQRGQFKAWDDDTVRLAQPPVSAPFYVFTEKTLDLATLSAAMTYQFRENQFLHPYVSGGARLGWLREHRFRDQEELTSPFPVTILALDEHTRRTLIRPFVAAGFKYYFNQRGFVRPDAIVTLGPNGLSDVTGRVVMGLDF